MDDDPIDGAQDQLACFWTPDAGCQIVSQITSCLLSAQILDDKSLYIISSDAGPRVSALPSQLSLADIITVAISPTHRVGRRHPVAVVVEDETAKNSATFDPSLAPLFAIARERGLNGVPNLLVNGFAME